jgi:DNA-binding response OmpR family regulator
MRHDVTMQVLLVEDDPAIAEPLVEGLTRHGLEVQHVVSGAAALEATTPDVVLLDLGLPDVDGLDVCREMRRRSNVPIIVVSARGEEMERVVGLEVGADDYLVKPFGLRELVARIRAVTRRAGGAQPAGPQVVGELTIDRRTRRVNVGGIEIKLAPKEFDLLALLAEDPGAVVSRHDILSEVWDPYWYGPSRTLDVHVAALRKKLGSADWIETVRSVGYRLGRVP